MVKGVAVVGPLVAAVAVAVVVAVVAGGWVVAALALSEWVLVRVAWLQRQQHACWSWPVFGIKLVCD